MLPNIGMGELLVILVIVLVFFGAKRVPELAKSLGKSIKSFKDGLKDGMENKSDDKDDIK